MLVFEVMQFGLKSEMPKNDVKKQSKHRFAENCKE
jgi:hypothetical protein